MPKLPINHNCGVLNSSAKTNAEIMLEHKLLNVMYVVFSITD